MKLYVGVKQHKPFGAGRGYIEVNVIEREHTSKSLKRVCRLNKGSI